MTRRSRRAREEPSPDVAARSLWKDLEDERRRGAVQALNVEDGALVVYYAKQPVPGLATEWRGYPVRQEKYKKPESELAVRGRGALLGVLGLIERDPERAFKLAEEAVQTGKAGLEFAQEHKDEVKKFLANSVVAGIAKSMKKRLERG